MNEYTTKDIYLASFLQLSGKTVKRLEQHNGNKFTFVFDDSAELRDCANEFYNRQARVEPMEYALVMKQLKSQMYNFRGN